VGRSRHNIEEYIPSVQSAISRDMDILERRRRLRHEIMRVLAMRSLGRNMSRSNLIRNLQLL